MKTAYDRGYGVLAWDQASPTVAGGSAVGQGAYAVADPRLTCEPRAGAYGVLGWDQPARTISGHHKVDNSVAAVADPRVGAPDASPVDWSSKRPLDRSPVLVARDGTWHRPLTLLDLAALQGLPARVGGAPLRLAGTRTGDWRTRIGNAVPVGAAKAIGEKMLATLLGSDLGAFSLSGDGVWVDAPDAVEPGRVGLQ